MKAKNTYAFTGLITAVTASLCCITPVLALIGGATGLASSFAWIEPFRPALIVLSIVVLGFAWYQMLKPVPVDDCGCEPEKKRSFLNSKMFLIGITVFSVLALSFPLYSSVFYGKTEAAQGELVSASNMQVVLKVEGMTCASCEQHIHHAVDQLAGVIYTEASYAKGNTIIQLDSNKIQVEDLVAAVNATGYKVLEVESHGHERSN